MAPCVAALTYVASSLICVAFVANRLQAWTDRTDPDALWHLGGGVLGGALAVAVRVL